jgi:hypothetical protein
MSMAAVRCTATLILSVAAGGFGSRVRDQAPRSPWPLRCRPGPAGPALLLSP